MECFVAWLDSARMGRNVGTVMLAARSREPQFTVVRNADSMKQDRYKWWEHWVQPDWPRQLPGDDWFSTAGQSARHEWRALRAELFMHPSP